MALLGLGSATASKLSERSGIDRTTTYDVLSRLMEGGLVSYVIKNNVKYFRAAPPENILADPGDKEKKVRGILPRLTELTKMDKEETKVEVYKGKGGIRTLYKMILRDGRDYFWMGGGSEACTMFPAETETFVRKAHAKNMKGRLLFREGKEFFTGESERYRLIAKDFISSVTTTVWETEQGFLSGAGRFSRL
ncbi:hypothetical protein GF318_00590 [Candidatus Micrarchaeota archaeon]|nr:hypothetical protein [Candidatus Micrarchaeota archaeon]